MMGSLITKANKSRSPSSQKVRATKGKKAASKKPQRPGNITTAPKSKKAAPAKSKKQASPAKKAADSKGKKVLPKAKAAKADASKNVKKPVAKRPAGKDMTAGANHPAKAVQAPPKKSPTPGALAAVRAFEQALRSFNRHDFSASKSSFEKILTDFSDQAEIVARARTYLAICEQRLARAPSAPRNPDALYDQGVFELNRGSVREAVDLFEKSLKAQPRADHVLYSLAAAYARLNDPHKALDALRRAIAIRSVHRPHARRDLDFASLRSNDEFQQLTGFGFEFTED
ncbi:MAG: TPR end-of-group domain-containing protein [Blastocatellia bacterium]